MMYFNEGDILKLSSEVAWKYKRRCWWANLDDLKQQASMAICEAENTYDPEIGDFGGYAYKACQYAISRYLWCSGKPVEHQHRPARLRDVSSIETDASPNGGMHCRQRVLTDLIFESWDNSYFEQDWRERVRARVMLLVRHIEDGDLAFRVLFNDETPSDVLFDDTTRVYHAVQRVKVAISGDIEMYRLWRDQ